MAKIKLEGDRCKGCLLCTTMCPKGLLRQGDEFNSFGFYTVVMTNEDECTGCSICAEICPDVAIEVWR
ncbi:MAG: 4Fe-4S binding protein [Nitrospirota bacterium]